MSDAAPFVGIEVIGGSECTDSESDKDEDSDESAAYDEAAHRAALQRLREDIIVPMISAEEAERTDARLLPGFLTEEEVLHVLEAGRRMPGAVYDELMQPGDWEGHPAGPHVAGLTAKHDKNFSASHVALNLHRGGYFAAGWPQLTAKITGAMRSQPGHWCDEGVALHIRCIELHTYAVGGGLMMVDHRDYGSALTMSILLSEAACLEGGELLTWREGAPVVHAMGRGDALLFHSEKVHNVSPIEKGERRSLVIELWVRQPNQRNRYE